MAFLIWTVGFYFFYGMSLIEILSFWIREEERCRWSARWLLRWWSSQPFISVYGGGGHFWKHPVSIAYFKFNLYGFMQALFFLLKISYAVPWLLDIFEGGENKDIGALYFDLGTLLRDKQTWRRWVWSSL